MFLSEAASWQSRNRVQRKRVTGLHMYQGRIDNFCRLRISKLAVYFLAVLRISISLSYRSGQSAKFGAGSHHLQMKRASTFRASRKRETVTSLKVSKLSFSRVASKKSSVKCLLFLVEKNLKNPGSAKYESLMIIASCEKEEQAVRDKTVTCPKRLVKAVSDSAFVLGDSCSITVFKC